MSSTTSGPPRRQAANDNTSWATDARRLAQEDLGGAPWIARLTQGVVQAADDDLGTFIVARAALTRAAAEHAAEQVRQRSEQAARLAREHELAAAAEQGQKRAEARARSARRQGKLKAVAFAGAAAVVLFGIAFTAMAVSGDSVPAVGEVPVVAWSPTNSWREDGRIQGVVPQDLTDVVQLAAGSDHFVALRSDGTVTAWSSEGEPGIAVPEGLTGVAHVAAWRQVSVAAKSDGTLVAWGEGSTDVPSGITDVAQVAEGIALHTDGTVSVWGPDPCNDDSRLPVPAGVVGVVQVEGDGRNYFALRQDGSILAWEYYCPNGLPEADVEPPAELPSGALQIAVGYNHKTYGGQAAALRHDGTVEAWGIDPADYNRRIELPDGFAGFVQVAVGSDYFLGVRADGTVLSARPSGGNLKVPPELSRVDQVVAGDDVAVAFRR